MTTEQAINHFGSRDKLAKALGIWVSAVYAWGEYPPELRQYEIEVKTNGALKAEGNKDE